MACAYEIKEGGGASEPSAADSNDGLDEHGGSPRRSTNDDADAAADAAHDAVQMDVASSRTECSPGPIEGRSGPDTPRGIDMGRKEAADTLPEDGPERSAVAHNVNPAERSDR